MGKDVVVTHSIESSNKFLSTKYHSLKQALREYLVRRHIEREINKHGIKLGTGLICIFVLMNVFYLIIALLLLAAGVASELAYLCYGLKFEFNLISLFWSVNGVALLCCSIVGIIAGCKNSVSWTHIYIILMTITVVLQLSIAVFGFTLTSASESIARHTLDKLMHSYDFYQPSTVAMDWIQKKMQCCGVDGPKDWSGQWKYIFKNKNLFTLTTNRIPESCFRLGCGYSNLQCDYRFQEGCLGEMHEIISETLMINNYVGLAIAVCEIIGIVSAFAATIKIRRTKFCRDADVINKPMFLDVRLSDAILKC